MILCNRCIRGVKCKGEIIVGKYVDDIDETCEWCEMSEVDLYNVRIPASTFIVDTED